jgi:hypothetical protein
MRSRQERISSGKLAIWKEGALSKETVSGAQERNWTWKRRSREEEID